MSPKALVRELDHLSRQRMPTRVESVFYNHRHINSVDKFMNLYYEDFMALEGVGDKTALALVDLQTRIKNGGRRAHVERVRSVDARNNTHTDIRRLGKSPLTEKIEKILGISIAGTTDEIINAFNFTELGRFLLVTAGWLEGRKVTVAERNRIFDIQEQLRGWLFRQSKTVYYSDNNQQLLLSSEDTSRATRFITATNDYKVSELYFVDTAKGDVLRIEHGLFITTSAQQIDAGLLNRIADHYSAVICKNTLAISVGLDALGRHRV